MRKWTHTIGKNSILVCGAVGHPAVEKVTFDGKEIGAVYELPKAGRRDIVSEIQTKKENVKRKRIRTRCFGTNSCDCPKCR